MRQLRKILVGCLMVFVLGNATACGNVSDSDTNDATDNTNGQTDMPDSAEDDADGDAAGIADGGRVKGASDVSESNKDGVLNDVGDEIVDGVEDIGNDVKNGVNEITDENNADDGTGSKASNP